VRLKRRAPKKERRHVGNGTSPLRASRARQRFKRDGRLGSRRLVRTRLYGHAMRSCKQFGLCH
jgi:hypothetical protein